MRWPLVGVVFVSLAILLPLLGYPLAIFPREWATQRFDFHFPWAALAVAVLLMGVAFLKLAWLPFSRPAGWIMAAPLVVLVSQVVSALVSGPSTGQLDALFRTATGVCLCLAAARFLSARWLRPMAIAWALAAAVEAAVMLLQAVLRVEPVGTAGNRNFAACFLAMSLPIGVACAMTPGRSRSRRRKEADAPLEMSSDCSRRRMEAAASQTATLPPPYVGGYERTGHERSIARWVAASYAILLLSAMMVSESRGAAFSLLAVAAGWWLARRQGTRWLAAGAAIVVIVGLSLLPPARSAAKHLWNTDVRPMIWLGSARAIADAPLTGHGPGSFARVYPAHRPAEYFDRPKCAVATDHAHNEFLEIAVETGALGVMAFMAVLVAGALAARRATSRGDAWLRPVSVGVTMGWSVLVLQNLVDINLFMPPNDMLFWLMTGWLLSASRAGDKAAEKAIFVHPVARLAAGAAGAVVLVVGVAQPAMANWLFREGLVARSAGDERHALDYFRRVVQMDPDRMEAWRQAGLAAHRLGNLDAAVAAFRRAHQLMPDYADLNGELGSLLAMKEDYAGAARLLTRATELFPRDPAHYVKLALVRQSLKEPEAARRAFEEAKRLDPNHPLVRAEGKKFSPPESNRVTP